jgi:pimeloyl-ACP methyl ester carboxylesterase
MWEEIKQLKVPVKLLYGTQDKVFPVEDAFDIKDAIPGICSITGLPQCNHYAHVQHPYIVAYHILKFTDECESNKEATKF